MSTTECYSGLVRSMAALALALGLTGMGQARVLDDFSAGKAGWTDYPVLDNPDLIPPTKVENGHFVLDVPQFSVGLSDAGLFTSSIKTTEEFTISEGRTVEFRIDIVQGAGNDAYAVLAFVPDGVDPKQTLGYSIAKSANEVLLVKALNHYLVDDDTATGTVKHENVTLVLSLTGKDGNVIITGAVLDKDSENAVLWQRTAIDTPGVDFGNEAELGAVGQRPFLTKGKFGLYLYAIKRAPLEETYAITFDNAEAYVLDYQVVDDFSSGKSAWTDYPVLDNPDLIPPTKVENGHFVLDVPPFSVGLSDAGLFTASVLTTKEFAIQEGEQLEFRADLVEGAGNDAYAVLAFVPNGVDPKQTLGYSLAKSANEILLVKALDHYFLDDDTATGAVKHNNVTLVLSFTGKDGNVILTGAVLDKDDNNAVLWQRTEVDTPGVDFGNEAELGAVGQRPFLTKGRFAFYLYAIKRAPLEDTYRAVFDNATVGAPPAIAANQPPAISQITPANTGNFLAPSTGVSFLATDDKDLPDAGLSITLNGTNYTTANGLVVSGTGGTKTASLTGQLALNTNYKADLTAVDSDGATTTSTLYFDTFAPASFVIEVEDYDFDSGQFINNPVPTAEGGGPGPTSYTSQTGIPDVDYYDTRTSPDPQSTLYRPNDTVRMQHTLDRARSKFEAAGGSAAGVYDYDVGDIAADEWLNYTRNFTAGSYEVYLRESLLNIENARSDLYLVTAQQTNLLGSFLGTATGFNYRNFALTDGAGLSKVVVRLSGRTTLRLQQVTADPSGGSRFENYLVFVPVADVGQQRATVSEVSPAAGAAIQSAFLTLHAVILNRDTSVNVSSVRLQYDGQEVPAAVTPTATGATVTYTVPVVPPPDVTKTVKVTFQDNTGTDVTTEWSFSLHYVQLKSANARQGTAKDPGFRLHVVQEDKNISSDRIDSTAQAEQQLALQNPNPPIVNAQAVVQVVNLGQDDSAQGYFQAPDYPDTAVPGLSADYGLDDFSVELKAWLQLKAGSYRLGVRTDDGFKLSSGATLDDKTPVLMLNDGTSDFTIDFVAPVDGFYPFRMIWYERGGAAYAELFSVDPVTGRRTLINDPASTIKAFTDLAAAPVQAQFNMPTVANGAVTLTWTGTGVLQESVDLKTWSDVAGQPQSPYNVPLTAGGPARFYRIKQ